MHFAFAFYVNYRYKLAVTVKSEHSVNRRISNSVSLLGKWLIGLSHVWSEWVMIHCLQVSLFKNQNSTRQYYTRSISRVISSLSSFSLERSCLLLANR